VLGGLARRVALVKKLRADGQSVMVVDSGDLFFDRTQAQADVKKTLTKARLIAQAYKEMGPVAVNVGDRDLYHGVDFLKQEAAQGLPLISANLVDPVRKTPIFSPYVIHEVSGIRIAFVGLLKSPLPPSIAKAVEGEAVVEDPIESVRKVMDELKGKADLIIILSDLGWHQDLNLAKTVAGIPFILGGHDGRYVKYPYQEGGTFIVQSYQKGMYVGKLALTVDKAGPPFQDERRPERIQEEIRKLDRRIRALQRAHERNPSSHTERQIEGINQEKAALLEEMRQAGKEASRGNHFRWSLEPLSASLPEDAEVRSLIEAAGITGD